MELSQGGRPAIKTDAIVVGPAMVSHTGTQKRLMGEQGAIRRR